MEFNEDNLRANNFKDPWSFQKERESNQALKEFEGRIQHIDSISNIEEKWLELTKGVLAGNVFDWGARAVSDILEQSHNFGLKEAMNTIQKRPWFIDNLDSWIDRLKVIVNILEIDWFLLLNVVYITKILFNLT